MTRWKPNWRAWNRPNCWFPTKKAGPPAVQESRGVRRRAPWLFDADSGRRQLLQFFGMHDLSGFGIDDKPLAIAAAGALLGYVEETQKQRLPHLTAIAVESSDDAIAMNAATRRHLELDSRVDGDLRATLLGVLDTTITPMGGRLLRRWLHRPLRNRQVRRRAPPRGGGADRTRAPTTPLREAFRGLGDLERILSRVALRSARPRDLSTLRDGLSLLPALREILVVAGFSRGCSTLQPRARRTRCHRTPAARRDRAATTAAGEAMAACCRGLRCRARRTAPAVEHMPTSS